MHVLLVEDEPRVADFIDRGLRAENHGVTVAPSGAEGIELAKTGEVEKRAEISKKLNDMLTKDSYTIVALADRGRFSARSLSLAGVIMNPWDSELWNVQDWSRVK